MVQDRAAKDDAVGVGALAATQKHPVLMSFGGRERGRSVRIMQQQSHFKNTSHAPHAVRMRAPAGVVKRRGTIFVDCVQPLGPGPAQRSLVHQELERVQLAVHRGPHQVRATLVGMGEVRGESVKGANQLSQRAPHIITYLARPPHRVCAALLHKDAGGLGPVRLNGFV